MERHIIKILSVDKLTGDVLRIVATKPEGYHFVPGQATEVAINKEEWKEEKRPFTFTSLPGDEHLELIIKTYPSRSGVTAQLLNLQAGDELIIHDVWGAIHYKGPGVFIAGGAGITPFISIFRHLAENNALAGNKLLFANKTKKDIILEEELQQLLGHNVIHILSEEKTDGYKHGFIKKEVLHELLPWSNNTFYVCGPPPMMEAVVKGLTELGVTDGSVVMEI